MKKILIASYYFPPCNVVSAPRVKSFAENFKEHGLYPIVVTRHWKGDEISTEGYEGENLAPPTVTKYDNFTLIQLPYRAQLNRIYHRPFFATKASKLLLYLFLYAVGNINPKCNAFDCFSDYLHEYLRETQVDYILATGFPMNTFKLAHRLAKEFDKPFIADFRDLWDNNLLADNYQPSLVVRLQNFIYEFYLRTWLKSASLITSVSLPLADEVRRLAPHAKSLVITNGFERELFAQASQNFPPPTNKFIFSVIGTLKPNQDLSVMLDGLKLFLTDKNLADIDLNFIGTTEFKDVAELIENGLPPACTRVSDRIPRESAIEHMCRSHVLFYAGWRGHRGIASGKIYEYLGARRNILIAPNDKDVLERIIVETAAGKIADSAQELADIMNAWFVEWKLTGKLEYGGVAKQIENYTRERQAEKLATEILKL